MSGPGAWHAAMLGSLLGVCAACGTGPVEGTPAPRHAPAEAPPEHELAVRGARRLTEPEVRATLTALLGVELPAGPRLPPVAAQRGFSRNGEQIVDGFSVTVIHELATLAAHAAVEKGSPAEFFQCPALESECALRAVREFGRRAFRRPLAEAEAERYRALFEAGSEGAEPASGIELVVATLLESPLFLYASAVGDGPPDAPVVRLTAHELASELAYAIAGSPPDAELDALADRGALFDAEAREREARRLFSKYDARFHYRRFVDEWLELDRLTVTAKDLGLYPSFVARRVAIAEGAWDFVDRAMIEENGTFADLIAGDDAGRVGLLEQPAFLAVHAHPGTSAPVLRGAAVLRRVLCRDFATPDELGIEVTVPAPDPNSTTRERFEAHVSDPVCAGCHVEIDAVGGVFEGFDAVGDSRQRDAGKPVDTSGTVVLAGREQVLSQSRDLALALAGSRDAESCLARQLHRYLAGRSDTEAEQSFVSAAAELPAARRASVVELSVFYVSRPHFAWRRSEP